MIVPSVNTLKLNESNPRTIKKDAFERLKKSLTGFTKMLEVRPIAYDEAGVIWGGNMRYRALQQLVAENLVQDKPEYYKLLENYTEEEKKEFAIRDNVELGDWDFDVLANEWSDLPLIEWGIKMPKETERLSDLSFRDMYYTPKNIPDIDLKKCINTEKYDAKVKVIEESDLDEKQKEALKMFAYRFLKIDFESVANYYYFNASDEEKRVMERLRLVLCDGGIDGFIEDDLLRVYSILENYEDD